MIMDLILLIVFALTIFLHVHQGFALCVARFCKGFVSLVVAYLFCDDVAKIITEKTAVGQTVTQAVDDLLTSKVENSGLYQSVPEILKGGVDKATTSAVDSISTGAGELIISILSFAFIVIVLRIALGIIVNMVKGSREKKGFVGKVDKTLGFTMGAIMGAFYVFLILALIFPVSSFILPAHCEQIMGWFDGSIISQYLYDHNLLLLLIGKLFV